MSLQQIQKQFIETLTKSQHKTAAFKIHLNNMSAARHTALSRTFPILQQIVGEKYFEFLAKQYEAFYPSPHYDLNVYGKLFHQFLSTLELINELPYLPQVADFEWRCARLLQRSAKHSHFNLDALQKASSAQVHNLFLDLNPASELCNYNYPILEIIELYQGKRETVTITADTTYFSIIKNSLIICTEST